MTIVDPTIALQGDPKPTWLMPSGMGEGGGISVTATSTGGRLGEREPNINYIDI